MNTRAMWRVLSLFSVTCLSLLLGALPAQAVPSFARQTGMPCAQCHTSFPELTSFGRHFKADGYTLTTTSTVGGPGSDLALNATPPLSFMLQAGYTHTAKPAADSNPAYPNAHAQNNSVLLPQELSLFYAGRISPAIGAFTQITYSMVDAGFAMDNTDIRAATRTSIGGNTLVYGLTLNNNPSVQDLWNSTPVWGFPFASTEVAAPELAAPLLEGLGQAVAGLGGYAAYYMGSDLAYAEYTMYRSALVGGPAPLDSSAASNVIRNFAPYLRLAYEHDFGASSWEVGMLNLHASTTPGGSPVDSTPTDHYADTGLDGQLQIVASDAVYGVKALYLKEKQSWSSSSQGSAATNASDNLTSTRLTGSYTAHHQWGANVQLFSVKADADALLYPDASGNRPDSSGEVVEVNYTPWLNTRFSAQYTAYSKLNGTGDKASDANSVYLLAWFMF